GGNFMSDGLGTSFSSELILEENPFLSEAEIDDIMYQFMGVERYIKMTTLPYDVIHHIDMHMKLLDEETILMGQYPPNTADGPQIEANLQYVLSNFNSSFGTPYEVVRIPMPPDNGQYPNVGWADYRTYTNSVIVNKTILMPAYEASFDQVAIDIYETHKPGYKVIPIDCNQIIESLGALHCITKEVGVDDPLWIVHQHLKDVQDVADDFAVDATIKHRDGIAGATLYYTTDTTQAYQSVPMTLTNADEDTWTGFIPNPAEDAEIFYYIEGEANNGKMQIRPMTAPAGYWNFWATFTNVSYDDIPEPETALQAIYPNPASAITAIPVTANSRVEAQIELLDVLGRSVRTIFSGTLDEGEQNFFIDAREFPAGSYIVQMRNGNQIHNQKLIIR
ncbi:MAG: agmatine deiminase family protein, partial [Bacteroidota bacterium]